MSSPDQSPASSLEASAPVMDDDFTERLFDLIFEVSQESFSLTEADIEREEDEHRRAIMTGLLMLHDELRYQNEQRTLAEEQAKRREERLRALVDLAKVSIWDCGIAGVMKEVADLREQRGGVILAEHVPSVNRHLRIEQANAEALRVMGAASIEALEAHVQTTAAEQAGELFAALWNAIADGERRVEAEGLIPTCDGQTLMVLAGLSLPGSEEGGHDMAILTLADLSAHHARLQAEQEAAQRTEELSRVNREVERLFYAVAHDLRSPLRAVDTLASFIVDDLESGETDHVHKHASTLRGRVARLDNMMNDLLSYARIGRTQTPKEVVEVDEVLTEIASSMLDLPEGFEVTWDGTTMPTLETYRTLLSQVLFNLINNAIKHHDEEQGCVQVTVAERPDDYLFRVIDDGPGVPEEYRERIFSLFSTLRRRDEVEGSGIGLALVRKVLQKLGGDITVEPSDGRGATFAFTWPKISPEVDD